MLIPPLSHFNKLPNEALADCLKETLIRLENAGRWKVVYDTCIEVINAIQYREVKDSFANSAVYFVLTFIARATEEAKLCPQADRAKFFEILKGCIENKNMVKAVLSGQSALDSDVRNFLVKLGFKDLLETPKSQNLDGLVRLGQGKSAGFQNG